MGEFCVGSYDARFKGRLDFSLLQQDPVDLPEEGVSLDGLLAALAHHAAQTLGRVLGHELNTRTQTHTDIQRHTGMLNKCFSIIIIIIIPPLFFQTIFTSLFCTLPSSGAV